MKKFHITQDDFGTISAAKEQKYENVTNIIVSIRAASAKKALESFDFRVENGSIKIPKIPKIAKQKPIKESKWYIPEADAEIIKAIFCDFNGVIDDYSKNYAVRHLDAYDKLPLVACPRKMMKVVKLALKYNAPIVMTSLWRLEDIAFSDIIGRCFEHSKMQHYIDFYEEHKEEILRLSFDTTCRGSSRSFEIKEYIMDHDITHCVVFEDEHDIDNCLNPIMTNSSIGLLDEHIDAADEILMNSNPVSF
jgi:hypothetical protein